MPARYNAVKNASFIKVGALVKKLVNNPRHVVREMLEGLVDLHPGQALLADEDVILRANLQDPSDRPVAVLSGGGSGHEPAHAGYVGDGMLAAAIAGDVFTSPSVDAVLTAIRAASGPRGALLVVKNYTGDRLNFGLAAELATAGGIPTKVVVVADDVALRDTVEPARRRGIAGTIFVHKIAGAAAASGLDLDAVVAEAEAAAKALGTMGVALGACTVPAAGKPGFSIGDDEMELGLGIHGEQGVRRVSIEPADKVVDIMLDVLIADKAIVAGDRVALLVNGLGGTPAMELAIVARRALQSLRAHKIKVERAWSGNFMTALEMPGVSLSLLTIDDARLARLDAPTNAPAWPRGGAIAERKVIPSAEALAEPPPVAAGPLAPALKTIAFAIASAFEKQEAALTELDSRAGDGDLGISMARGAEAIRALRQNSWANPSTALAAMGNALGRAIAGSSTRQSSRPSIAASQRGGLPHSRKTVESSWAYPIPAEPLSGGSNARDFVVNCALEGVICFEDRRVGERQHLRHDEPADPRHGIYPEIGVGEPRPAHAARISPLRRGLEIEEKTQSPPLRQARKKVRIVRKIRHNRFQHARRQRADAVARHQRDGLRLEHRLAAFRLTARQHHLDERSIVEGSAAESAATHEELRGLCDFMLDRNDRAIGKFLMNRGAPPALRVGLNKIRVVHAQWRKQLRAQVVAERLAADDFDELANPVDADAVFPFFARVGEQRLIQRPLLAQNQIGKIVLLQVAQNIAIRPIISEPRGMGEQVSRRDGSLGGAQLWRSVRRKSVEH